MLDLEKMCSDHCDFINIYTADAVCSSIPIYFKWLEYLSWFKYSNECMVVNQWKDVDYICTLFISVQF